MFQYLVVERLTYRHFAKKMRRFDSRNPFFPSVVDWLDVDFLVIGFRCIYRCDIDRRFHCLGSCDFLLREIRAYGTAFRFDARRFNLQEKIRTKGMSVFLKPHDEVE